MEELETLLNFYCSKADECQILRIKEKISQSERIIQANKIASYSKIVKGLIEIHCIENKISYIEFSRNFVFNRYLNNPDFNRAEGFLTYFNL